MPQSRGCPKSSGEITPLYQEGQGGVPARSTLCVSLRAGS